MFCKIREVFESTEFQYENLFELYGTHYASTFDLGYEINAAEFSSECDSSEENTLSTTRENCFEASFQYKFTNLGGDGCITKTSDISTDEEEFMSFETATFEVRGGKDAENSALLDRLAEMKFGNVRLSFRKIIRIHHFDFIFNLFENIKT